MGARVCARVCVCKGGGDGMRVVCDISWRSDGTSFNASRHTDAAAVDDSQSEERGKDKRKRERARGRDGERRGRQRGRDAQLCLKGHSVQMTYVQCPSGVIGTDSGKTRAGKETMTD